VKRKAHLFHTAIYLCPRSFSPSFGKHTHNAHVFQSERTPYCGPMCPVEKYIHTSTSERFSPLIFSLILENPLPAGMTKITIDNGKCPVLSCLENSPAHQYMCFSLVFFFPPKEVFWQTHKQQNITRCNYVCVCTLFLCRKTFESLCRR
jgi:hypothetical protein